MKEAEFHKVDVYFNLKTYFLNSGMQKNTFIVNCTTFIDTRIKSFTSSMCIKIKFDT